MNVDVPNGQKYYLTDTNAMISVGAARVLGQLGADPAVFMPAVVESLRELDFTFLDYKLEVLLKFKDQARDAVPVLSQFPAGRRSVSAD